MLDIVTQFVIPAAVGAAASFFAPWAHWGVEKRRLKQQERRRRVEAWREMIAYFNSHEKEGLQLREFLERNREFYSLKPLLSPEFRQKLYAQRRFYVPADGATIGVLADSLIDEVARIEREWRLV